MTLLMLAALLQQPPDESWGFRSRAEYLFADLGGTMEDDDSASFQHDLDIGRVGVPGIAIGGYRRTADLNVAVDFVYWTARASGEATLDAALFFDGTLFPAGAAVDGEVRIDYWALEIGGDIAVDPCFRFGAILPLQLIRASVDVETASLGERSTDGDLLYGIGLYAQARPIERLFASASAMLTTGLLDSFYTDVSLSVGAEFGPARVELGWRYRAFEDAETGDDLRFRMHGLFVALSVSF